MITRRRFLQLLVTLGVAGSTVPAYGFGIEPLRDPAITPYRLRPPGWPADLRLKIAVLADLHACRPWMDPDRIAGLVARTNSLGADLVLLLGDYETGHRFVTTYLQPDEWAVPLGKLRAPLGVHAVLGNHDWWQDPDIRRTGHGVPRAQRALEAAGIAVHHNTAVRIETDGPGGGFWLAGLGDQLAYAGVRHLRRNLRTGADDLPGTMAQVAADGAPVILMAHEPDIVMKVPERVSLVLCGHTHGGQVRLFGWSPVVPSRYGNRFAYGHVTAPRDMVVSGGLGCSTVPFRLGMPPEIVLIELGDDPPGA